MPDAQMIPEKGDHVRLGVDPREVGIPPATVQEGSRLVVEEAILTEEGYSLEVRLIGEETTYRLKAAHVAPID
jgi:hypothetical protein